MIGKSLFKSSASFFVLVFLCQIPLTARGLQAQLEVTSNEFKINTVAYNHLTLTNVTGSSEAEGVTSAAELTIEPLSKEEEKIAKNLDSQWAWRENTLEMIDSYSPFLFRTKKSAAYDQVKVVLQVNSKGRLSGFEIVGEVDKGLRERIDFMVRKLPDCKPVPGFTSYTPETFELIIKK